MRPIIGVNNLTAYRLVGTYATPLHPYLRLYPQEPWEAHEEYAHRDRSRSNLRFVSHLQLATRRRGALCP